MWGERNKSESSKVYKLWGESTDHKDEYSLRITGTNIFGLASLSEISQLAIGSMQIQGDINCYQEVNVDTNQQKFSND